MKLVERLKLVAKGLCMGGADVIPGVSGGTMALVLGIYVEFINGIKSLNLRFVKPGLAWIASGFKGDKLGPVKEALATIHWGFLVPLGAGIVVAFGLASKIVPDAMANYPVQMRAFFFGLVLASIWVPLRMMKRKGPKELVAAVVLGLAAYFAVGLSTDHAGRWDMVTVEGQGETVEELALSVPSSLTPAQLLALPENQPVLTQISLTSGLGADAVAAMAVSSDPRHTQANELVVPAGAQLMVPVPPYWFIFLCGIIAICAMILPGISGSFFLLALGTYYFMLNALKGFLKGLVHLEFSASHTLFVVLFITGMVIGMVAFSRVLAHLFRRFPSVTLAAMTGMMIGCLRRIWPYQDAVGHNRMPVDGDVSVLVALIVFAIGAAIVTAFNWLGRNKVTSLESL
jgi:putative membrane protein